MKIPFVDEVRAVLRELKLVFEAQGSRFVSQTNCVLASAAAEPALGAITDQRCSKRGAGKRKRNNAIFAVVWAMRRCEQAVDGWGSGVVVTGARVGWMQARSPDIAPGPLRASDLMHTHLLSVNVLLRQRHVQAGVCSAEVKADASACTTKAFVMQAHTEQQACASCESLLPYHKWSELCANPAQCCCSLVCPVQWALCRHRSGQLCQHRSGHSANTAVGTLPTPQWALCRHHQPRLMRDRGLEP